MNQETYFGEQNVPWPCARGGCRTGINAPSVQMQFSELDYSTARVAKNVLIFGRKKCLICDKFEDPPKKH